MGQNETLKQQMKRIGDAVEQLEAATDPRIRAMAKELLESLMAFHGAGLERILELAAAEGQPGEALTRKLAHDELVSGLLILYGLHPEDLQTRVTRALENLNPRLQRQNATAELVSIDEAGAIKLRLVAKAGGCGSTAAAIKSNLEAAMQDAAPDATSIVVEEAGAAFEKSGFVSLAQLEKSACLNVLSAAAPRSGD